MVPALAFFGAGAAGAGAGAIIASVIVSSVINYAIATVLGQLLAPSNPHSGKNTRGLQRNIKSNIAPRTVVYGRCNVGGPFLQISTGGQTNDYLNIIIAVAGHPIEDVVGVFFNEEYINIGGDAGSNDLDTDYYVKLGKFGTTATDSPKYQSTRIVKVLGWGFADFNYVTDETQTKCSDDRTRANAIDTFSGVDFTWNPPGGGVRDSQTGLYPEGEKATNCAYVYIQLKYNPEVFSGGIPKFKFHVKGKHLYNPYLDGTKVAEGAVSGSAPHRLDDPDTWEYSDDWTLALLDYLINDQFGLGAKTTGTTADPEEIDWVEAIASHTVSSEIISAGRPSPFTTTIPRYRTNGVFDVSSTPVSIVEGLLSGANGELIYAQGKYKIRPAIYRLPNSPNDIINEDDIVGNLTIRTHTPRSEIFNKASGVFIDKGFAEGSEPSNNNNTAMYEPSDFNTVDPVDSSGNNPYVVADGEEIVKEFDYPYVTDRYTAQRLARISLERIRRGISVSFEGTMNLVKYSVGDTVYLEILSDSRYANEAFFNRLGLDDTVQNRPDSPGTAYYKQFKIIDMQYTENSTIAVTMIEEAEEIYDWQPGYASDSDETLVAGIPGDNPNSDILVPDFNVASPFQTVEEVIGTETGTTVTTLLRWSAPQRSSANEDVLDIKNIGSYRIEYGVVDNPSQANAENRVSVWIPKGTRLADIGNVTQGPISFESLYKDGVDYDFRIASITHTGRQSEFAYYSDFAGSDYTPTQSAAAAQSVRAVNMYNLNDNTVAEASGGTFQVPISSGNASDGWSLNVPSMTANGDIIYVTTRTFTDDAQSPQDPAWASPTIYAQRVDGTQGLTVSLTADKLAFTYDSNGNNPASPAVANFTATSFNFDSAEEYRFLVDGVEQSPGWTTDNTFTYNAPASYNTLPQVITVEARNNGGTVAEASDIVTVVGIKPGTDGTGANAYTIVLSNEAHTLSTDNLGNVVYTGSGTTIDVYDGTTQLNSVSGTPSTGQYAVTPSVISGTVTVGTPIDVSGNTAIVPDHSSMSTDDAVIRYSINIENTLTLTKDQSLSKAIEGADGIDGQAVRTVNIYNLNDSNIDSPQNWGTFNEPVDSNLSTDGWSLNVPTLSANNDIVYVSTRTFTNDAASPQDPTWSTPTIYSQRTDGVDGADGIAIKSVNMYKLNDSTVGQPTAGTFADPLSGQEAGWSLTVPSLTADGDQVYVSTRSFTFDGSSPQDPSWSTPTIYAQRTDGATGATGQAVRTVNVYKLNDSTMGTPTAGTFNDPLSGIEAGWTLSVPSLASNGDSVYVSTRTFTDDAASPQDPSWSTPTIYATRTDGTDGATGQAVRTVNMYNLNDNTVADTTGGTFETPISATNVTDGWTLSVPTLASNGDIVYVTTRTFADDAASPQDPSWPSPTIYAQRTDGATGATGQAVRTVNMYNLNDNTVADTTGGTFNSPISGTNSADGWTLDVPSLASNGDIVYVTTRTFTDDAASPQDPSWPSPTIYAQRTDGAGGATGQAVRTVNMYNLNDNTVADTTGGTFETPISATNVTDGWTLSVPALTADGDNVYVSTRTFTDDAASPQDPSWSTPTVYATRTDGVDGVAGQAVRTVNIYKLNDSTIGAPTAGTFNDPLNGQEAGWSLDVPALASNNDQVYVSTRTFTNDAASPQDPSWSTPSVYAQRTDGTDGATGQAVRTVNMYNLNDNTVADTSGGTFNTPISATNVTDGWTLDVPSLASNGDIVYVSTRTFTDDAASPQDPSWSTPTVYAQRTDGAGGATGQAVRTVNVYKLNDSTMGTPTAGTFNDPLSGIEAGWTLNVPSLASDGDQVYVSTRTFTDDAASPQDPSWSTPTVYAQRTDGATGATGQAVRTVNIYKLNDSTIGAPTAGTFNDPLSGQEAGWTLSVPSLASNNDQVYVSTRTFTDDAASPQDPSWSTPTIYAQRTDGATGATGQAVRTVNMYNLNDNTVADTSGGTFATPINGTNAGDGWTLSVPALTADGDTVYVSTRTFTDDAQSPQDPTWSTPTAYATRTDGVDGVAGQAVRTVNMYNKNDNSVADTTGGTFNDPISATNTSDGWTLNVPSLTADGDVVYVTTRTFTNDAQSPQDPSWGTVTVYSQRTDGATGATGQAVRTVNMYNLNDNTVADNSGGTFVDPISATNVTDGWSLNVPSMSNDGDIVYVTVRTFTDDGQSPQDPTWGTPTVYATRQDGIDSVGIRQVNIYNLNDGTLPNTTDGTYDTPISGAFSADGWTLGVPTLTNDGDVIYTSSRTFTSGGLSPQDPNWATPTVYSARVDGKVGFGHNLFFSSTDADTVAWTTGSIYKADGTVYNGIVAGNTGNMAVATPTYIYFDSDVSTTVLQTTTNVQNAVGANRILLAYAEYVNTTDTEAVFQVFGGRGGIRVHADQIVANTITSNQINSTFYTGRVFTGGTFQTREPSVSSPYETTPRAVITTDSEPYIGVFLPGGQGDEEVFGVADVGGNLELRMVGDFQAGTIPSGAMFSTAGLTDLRLRLGVPEPGGGEFGGTITRCPPTEYIPTTSTDTPIIGTSPDPENYNTGGALNTITFTLYDYDQRTGSSNNPYTAPQWSGDVYYSTTSSTGPWTLVPGGAFTCTGTATNTKDDASAPWVNTMRLNCTETVAWDTTGTISAGAPVWFMLRTFKDSGDHNNPRITALQASEPIANNFVDQLNEMTDVTLTSPTDGALLIYDTGTSQWRDQAMSGDATINDVGAVSLATNSVSTNEISATGTPSSGTYLRGDMTWASISTVPGSTGADHVLRGNGSGGWAEATNIEFATTGNIRLPNSIYYQGKTTGGVNVDIMGMNSSNWFEIGDPGYNAQYDAALHKFSSNIEVAGGTTTVRLDDSVKLNFGTSNDMSFSWNGAQNNLEVTLVSAGGMIELHDGCVVEWWNGADTKSVQAQHQDTSFNWNIVGGAIDAWRIRENTGTCGSFALEDGIDLRMGTGTYASNYAQWAATSTTYTLTGNGTMSTLQLNMTNNRVIDGSSNYRDIGFNVMPVSVQSTSFTVNNNQRGYIYHKNSGGAITVTLPNSSQSTYVHGSVWLLHNDDTENITITTTSPCTLHLIEAGGVPTTGDITLESGGIVTLYRYSTTEWWCWGSTAPAAAAATITVADESTDTTCFPVFVTAATGSLAPKTGSNLTFNSSSGLLTAGGGVAFNNANATGVGALVFNDPGPGEGLSWSGGNFSVYESPDDLVTNSAGNLQFVSGGARRMTIGTDGVIDFGKELTSLVDATQPWLTLDSTGSGDSWSSQGAGISVGESGKRGAAAIHMTYNGDGSGYMGMGTVDNTATTGGRPAWGHFDFTYNNNQIKVGGRLYPGGYTATTATAPVIQSTAYIEAANNQNYGSINVEGAVGTSGSYAGYSIGRVINFMRSGSTAGIYNDSNNHWCLQTPITSNTSTGKTSSAMVMDHSNVARPVGFNNLRTITEDASVTLGAQHAGGVIFKDGTAAITVTCETGTDFPTGAVVTIINAGTSGNITVADGGQVLYYLDGSSRTDVGANCTISPGGVASLWREADGTTDIYYIWGSGITA